jgi:hypothetical protein
LVARATDTDSNEAVPFQDKKVDAGAVADPKSFISEIVDLFRLYLLAFSLFSNLLAAPLLYLHIYDKTINWLDEPATNWSNSAPPKNSSKFIATGASTEPPLYD